MTKMRNICILTQPLRTNYGGLLQAYALQQVLIRMGHKVVTDLHPYRYEPVTLKDILYFSARQIVKKLIGREFLGWVPYRETQEHYRMRSHCMTSFIDKHIHTIDLFQGNPFQAPSHIDTYDAFIVGSDQVWRPRFNDNQLNYFLEFLGNRQVTRVAYAASFGVDHNEYPKSLQRKCRSLAQRFDAISVREASAEALCQQLFGTKAQQVLDPTMLLTKDDYIALIDEKQYPKREKTLFTYFFDASTEDKVCIEKIAERYGLQINEMKLSTDAPYPAVEEWLAGFRDADLVITDSFHGTVFSILFNKPFISVEHKERGATRFSSLQEMFDLQDQFVSSLSKLKTTDFTINWQSINKILEKERIASCNFLEQALS